MDHQTNQKSRNLTKEKEPSFRFLYYGGTGAAVPFKWELQPGTPKHPLFSDYSSLPPLTPPPSFLARARPNPKPKNRGHRRLKIVVFLSRLVRRGSHVTPTSAYSSPSISSSSETSYYSAKARKSRYYSMRKCFRFGSFKKALFSVVGGGRSRSASLDNYFV